MSHSEEHASPSPFLAIRTAETQEGQRVEAYRAESAKQLEQERVRLVTERASNESAAEASAQNELRLFEAETTAALLRDAEERATAAIEALDRSFDERSAPIVSSLTEEALAATFLAPPPR